MNMRTSAKGIDLIKLHEGCCLVAYPDPASGGIPWTIGYGSTHGVHPGMKITPQQAEDMLVADLTQFEDVINEHVKVPLAQHEFDALVSLTYNIGPANFLRSSVLRDISAGNKHAAADAFLMWDRAAHHVIAGLHHRRLDERALFLSEKE
jgi:lysozyme